MLRISIILLMLVQFSFLNGQTELSLSQALEISLANNLQVRFQEKQITISENNDTWANAGRTPTIDIAATNQSAISQQINPANVILPEQLSYSTGLSGSMEMNLVLYNGGRVKYAKSGLGLQKEQAALNMRMAVEDLTEQVMLAYYQVLLVEEQETVLEEVKLLSKDRFDFQELRKTYGSASTFDVIQAKDAYLNDSIAFIQLENQIAALHNNLKLVMGLADSGDEYVLIDNLESVIPLLEKEALQQRMLDSNTDLLNLRLSDELALNNIDIQKTTLKPSIGLGLGVSGNLNSSYLDAENPITNEIIGSNTSTGVNPFLSISATHRLFDSGLRKTRIQNAEIQWMANKDLLQNMEQNISTQFENTYLQMETNQRVLNMSAEQLENASRNLEIAKDRFENGLISSFDYRTIQLGYLNASQSRLEARFNLINSQIALLNLTGGLYTKG
ncbi:MAG: TolC family protein [Saprospiraceae bacterium]|nr:TolC family protein [Saprospiraceae bacterium]